MIGADFAETEARVERVMGFIRDTVAEAHVSEPAGRGAGWSVDYDEASIRAFILEVMVGVALPLPPVESPAEVVAFVWEHDDTGKRLQVVHGTPTRWRCPGLRQIWIMRNGQEVRATWKRQP